MTDRVLDFAERPVRLNVSNGLLAIRLEKDPEMTVPLADIAVVIVSHPQVTLSHAVLSGLAEAGAIFVACNSRHMPAAMLLPLESHFLQTERFALQARLPLPAAKRLWQQIAREKILAQARLLCERTGQDHGLELVAGRVRSGDPENVESHAARIYWQAIFGPSGFRRDREAQDLNRHLNYGYAVLRAIVARALCGAGLHPTFGLHHHNRYDAFCLADDLMEPFRPLVDRAVAALADAKGQQAEFDREAKQAILKALLDRFDWQGESRTLFDWVSRCAFSLAAALEDRSRKLEIPRL